jgi:hypothetical protein
VTADQADRFARHYRGRHSPEDALWWLDHPDDPGPTSAPPPAVVLADTVLGLGAGSHTALAQALGDLVDLVLQSDRQLAALALGRALPPRVTPA